MDRFCTYRPSLLNSASPCLKWPINNWLTIFAMLVITALPAYGQPSKAPTFGFNAFETETPNPTGISLGGVAYKASASLQVDNILAGDGTQLTVLGATQLQRLAGAILVGRNVQKVRLIGHTDSIGSPADNLARGQRYADTVRASLYHSGIELELLHAESAGESSPIGSNINEAGRSKNRRVDVVIVGLKEPNLAGIISGEATAAPDAPGYVADDAIERVTLAAASLFNRGTAKINGTGEYALEQLATKLREEKGWSELVVIGHSFVGVPAAERMSKMQADSVLDYLVDHGIDARNALSAGLGVSVPMTNNPADPRNERIVVEIHRN